MILWLFYNLDIDAGRCPALPAGTISIGERSNKSILVEESAKTPILQTEVFSLAAPGIPLPGFLLT
jgi:hypothetical protein